MDPGDCWGFITQERKDNIAQVLSAFRSVRTPFSYISMPVTGGRRLYDFLEEKGARSREDLPEAEKKEMYRKVIAPNIEEGVAKADELRRLSSYPPLAPGVFEAVKQRWSQIEYMLLWFQVIDELSPEMFMTSNWGYTIGGAKEFVRAKLLENGLVNNAHAYAPDLFPPLHYPPEEAVRLRQMRVYDENKKRIPLDFGLRVIANTVYDLHSRGFAISDEYGKVASTLCAVLTDLRKEYRGTTADQVDLAAHMVRDGELDDCTQTDMQNLLADVQAIEIMLKEKSRTSAIAPPIPPRPSFWMSSDDGNVFYPRAERLPLPRYFRKAQQELKACPDPEHRARVTGELVL